MVKFGKKFFFSEEETTKNSKSKKTTKKKTKKNNGIGSSIKLMFTKFIYFIKKYLLIIIGIIILILIILFLSKACTKDNDKDKNKAPEKDKVTPKIVNVVTVNLNEALPDKKAFISNIDKFNDAKVEITFEETNIKDGKYYETGEYDVLIKINNETYSSTLLVKDVTKPSLELKSHTIEEGSTYKITDFIKSCTDDSNKECSYVYADSSYKNITKTGEHTIKIYATDLSGNKTEEKETKLIINKKKVEEKPSTTTKPDTTTKPNTTTKPEEEKPKCTYGTDVHSSKYPLIKNYSSNGCAISKKKANAESHIIASNKILEVSYNELVEQLKKKELTYTIEIATDVLPVYNKENKGLVGYTGCITVKNHETKEVIAKFYVNSKNKRTYVVNKIKL